MRPIAPAWHPRNDRYRPPRKLSVAAAQVRLLYSRLFNAASASQTSSPTVCSSHAPHILLALAEAGQGVAIIRRCCERIATRSNRPRNTPAQPATGSICHSVGRPAPNAALCQELLRGARQVHARGPPDYAAFGRQVGRRTEASCCPRTSQAHRPRLKGLLWVRAARLGLSKSSPLFPQQRTLR